MNIKESLNQKGEIKLRGWAQELRDLKKIKFIVLRDGSGEIQVILKDSSEKLNKVFSELTKESYIEVTGKLTDSKQAKLGKELVPSDICIISKSEQPLPIDISGKIETSLDKRLDWRFLDLRRREISSIFKIESEICRLFREFFTQKGFVEVWTPGIIAAASEGGTELFKVNYLGRDAYLAQSPQLYKQLLTMCNLEKVFLITPVWRAEPHNTTKHLNEIRQMDIEMANADDETVMKLLKEVVEHIIKGVKENCKEELGALNRELKMPKTVMLTYHEAIANLQKAGVAIKDGDDISSEAEKKLAELYGPENMIFLSKWPTKLKPFYIMPEEKSPKLSRGFDMDMGGIELTSGGQRIHIPELLTKRIKECGLNPKDFEFYINSFKYGAPPHAGWSIGLERITMIVCGLNNVREACLFPRDSVRLTP
jgi:aspartyl-tRNA synthetase